MPFDFVETAPSLRMLAAILRDKSRWPVGFEWDYSHCLTCAMGLAARLWMGMSATDFTAPFKSTVQYQVGNAPQILFNMSIEEDDPIFRNAQCRFVKKPCDGISIFDIFSCRSQVTPENVADAIDTYLEGVKTNNVKETMVVY